jgi:hypothetical protein
MGKTQTPDTEQPQFEEMCARLDEHEPLPTVVAHPTREPDADDEERTAPLDELILAGLVSPY